MKLYWWNPARELQTFSALSIQNPRMWLRLARQGTWFPRNFGDELSPLVAEFAYNTRVSWAKPQEADIFGLGSILEIHSSSRSSAVIWGSGARSANAQLQMQPPCRVVSVRGANSASVLRANNLPSPRSLGDPGLLVRNLNLESSSRTSGFGILPHFTAYSSAESTKVIREFKGAGFTVLSPWWSPERVVREISRLEFLATSSLHGLVVAHAMGTPAGLVTLAEEHEPRFKYDDYLSVFGATANFIPYSDFRDPRRFANLRESAELEVRRLDPLIDSVIDSILASASEAKALF
jgi:pyruvyltransferase